MIRHIVMWKLKLGDRPEKKMTTGDLIVKSIIGLKAKIPEIMDINAYMNHVEAPKNNYDIVLDATFKNMEDLEKYQVHPEHQNVASLIKPKVSDRSAIDIEV
jgi:hypothetical protein